LAAAENSAWRSPAARASRRKPWAVCQSPDPPLRDRWASAASRCDWQSARRHRVLGRRSRESCVCRARAAGQRRVQGSLRGPGPSWWAQAGTWLGWLPTSPAAWVEPAVSSAVPPACQPYCGRAATDPLLQVRSERRRLWLEGEEPLRLGDWEDWWPAFAPSAGCPPTRRAAIDPAAWHWHTGEAGFAAQVEPAARKKDRRRRSFQANLSAAARLCWRQRPIRLALYQRLAPAAVRHRSPGCWINGEDACCRVHRERSCKGERQRPVETRPHQRHPPPPFGDAEADAAAAAALVSSPKTVRDVDDRRICCAMTWAYGSASPGTIQGGNVGWSATARVHHLHSVVRPAPLRAGLGDLLRACCRWALISGAPKKLRAAQRLGEIEPVAAALLRLPVPLGPMAAIRQQILIRRPDAARPAPAGPRRLRASSPTPTRRRGRRTWAGNSGPCSQGPGMRPNRLGAQQLNGRLRCPVPGASSGRGEWGIHQKA